MAALALPLIALYFAAGGIGLLVDKRRARRTHNCSEITSSDIEEVRPIEKPEAI
jgi:hypothetical protein